MDVLPQRDVAMGRRHGFAGLLVMAYVLLHYFGNERVLIASGIAYVLVCGLVLCSRSVRDLQRVRVTPGARATTG